MADVIRSRGPLLKLVALVVLVGAGAVAAAVTPLGDYLGRDGIGQAIDWLRGSRAAPLLYIAIYASATALAIPGSILTLAGGAMFGLVGGTLYTTIGANIGASLAFGVGRFLGRDGVRRLAGDRLDALDRATEHHGFRGLLTLRLIPAVPFNALNFGSGLTSIGWSTYAAATAIGIFPGTVVYTMFADALLAGSQEASREALLRVLLSGGLLILLSFLPAVARRIGIRVPGAMMTCALCVSAPSVVDAQPLPTHEAFSAVLAEVVDPPSVDYAALVGRREALDAYIGTLERVSLAAIEGATREEQLAFWINAYNACMLRLVAEHYPIQKAGGIFTGLRNAIAGRPANSVWQIEDVFTVAHCRIAGALRSQDDIEHSIIRPMGEPRIHFAVNCAARSCPVLWPDAYEAATLEAQLERAVSKLVSTPEHFSVEPGVVRMNKVLDWFKEDFGGIEGLRTFFAPYLDAADAEVISTHDTRIEFFEYDWTLNDPGS
ncbi:MAG: VTT domain-containing protein [Longimicrobiales bacterium]